jgi:hypothetical protein
VRTTEFLCGAMWEAISLHDLHAAHSSGTQPTEDLLLHQQAMECSIGSLIGDSLILHVGVRVLLGAWVALQVRSRDLYVRYTTQANTRGIAGHSRYSRHLALHYIPSANDMIPLAKADSHWQDSPPPTHPELASRASNTGQTVRHKQCQPADRNLPEFTSPGRSMASTAIG